MERSEALGKQANAGAFVDEPRAVGRRSSEQGERKSGCPSQASYLIFRPASVATTCEAHEALTFGLLLGQAKSDGKEILRFALNDKLIVNCQLLYRVHNPYSFRLSALRRGGCPVSQRFATHWAELIRPFRAVTTVGKHLNNRTPHHLNAPTPRRG